MATYVSRSGSALGVSRIDVEEACRFFREEAGWPVSIDDQQRLVVATGTVLDAVLIPAVLARSIADQLVARLMSGPVAINGSWGWWTFLTQPCPQSQREIPPVLRAAKVTPVPRRGRAVLPLPDDPASWYQQPAKGQSLPAWTTVIATAQNVVERRRNTAQVTAI